MKLMIIKPIMTEPRFHFDRSLELSKYMEVTWICGWMLKSQYKFDDYEIGQHRIIRIGNGEPKRKIRGLIQEAIFVFNSLNLIKSNNADVILIHNHRLAFLYPLLSPKHNYVLLTFTPAVCESVIQRKFSDMWKWLISRPYRTIFVQTTKLIELYKISRKKCYITKWGMQPLSTTPKEYHKLSLLYIGTLTGRRIHETIEGLKLFIDKTPGVEITYSIIGTGHPKDVNLIKESISLYSLDDVVKYYGYLPDAEVKPFFDDCNIGVAYVPITNYYTDLIVTKTIEYLISGMAVIATATNENKKMINTLNGVLVQDTPESYAEGLSVLYRRLNSYNSAKIIEESKYWTNSYQIKESMVPILEEIARGNQVSGR